MKNLRVVVSFTIPVADDVIPECVCTKIERGHISFSLLSNPDACIADGTNISAHTTESVEIAESRQAVPMTNSIRVGRTGGAHYSQTVFDGVMVPLAEDIIREMPDCETVTISYDPGEDFYHAVFYRNGRRCDIRYYKVLSAKIDGVDGWMGCPVSQQLAFLISLKKKTEVAHIGA